MHSSPGAAHPGTPPPPAALPQRRTQSWVRRLLLAQESGLVLVIILLMTLLTVFAGKKTVAERVLVPQGIAIVNPEGPERRASIDGQERVFRESDGWTLEQRPAGTFFRRERTTSKFFNIENLMTVLVFASFIAIMAVGITGVIVMGGIDLSIGSTYALAALVGGIVLRYHMSDGWPGPTFRDSPGLWWAAVVTGVLLLGITKALKRKPSTGPASPASGRTLDWSAIHSGLLWAGAAFLLISGWALVNALWKTGGAGTTGTSTLPWTASLPLAIGVCAAVGGVCGWLNGRMVVGLKVHPFIITLGTMAAYRGLVALPTQAQTVANIAPSVQGFVKWSMPIGGGITITPVPVLVMLAVGLLGWVVLSSTVLGRRIYAIGGNETAARYAGIPVDHVKVTVYALMGALAGTSAFVYLGYFGAAETNAGKGYELNAIAAAVIGGASLSGGRGSAVGAVLGAILVGLIDNGIVMLGIDQNYNQIILGAAIIAAVVLDQFKGRLMPGR